MKYILAGAWLLSTTVIAYSATYTSQIHSIDKGKKGQPHLIMLNDGHTAFLEGNNKSLIDQIEDSQEKGDTVEFKLDQKLNVISIQTVTPERVEPIEMVEGTEDTMSYNPSILTLSRAQTMFSNMRRNYQSESQCYNRAHIWTYEEYYRSSIRSNKLFLFFTTRYIRNYRFYWWFHVTPMVYVGGSSQANWRTLDRRYTSSPLTTKTWTNIFMANNATCPVVYRYSDYRNHQSTRDCYLIPTSMFFWQPRDIERQENSGYVKTQYFSSEVSHAYWEAF